MSEPISKTFDVHLATSRLSQARRATVEWLERHKFPPHDLHFLKHGEKHASLARFFAAVEDHYDQAFGFAGTGTPCYLISHPWNHRDKPPIDGIYWVKNWAELTKTLLGTAPRPS